MSYCESSQPGRALSNQFPFHNRAGGRRQQSVYCSVLSGFNHPRQIYFPETKGRRKAGISVGLSGRLPPAYFSETQLIFGCSSLTDSYQTHAKKPSPDKAALGGRVHDKLCPPFQSRVPSGEGLDILFQRTSESTTSHETFRGQLFRFSL